MNETRILIKPKYFRKFQKYFWEKNRFFFLLGLILVLLVQKLHIGVAHILNLCLCSANV